MGSLATVEAFRPVNFVSRSNAAPAKAERCATLCSSCGLRELCLPRGMDGKDANLMDDLVTTRRNVKRGDILYRAGTTFRSIYAVRSGFFKSYALANDGREQVTGFQMAGEIVGLDGIETDTHSVHVQALEDSVVCVIPFERLEEMAGRSPALRHQLHRMMSREIVRDQSVMMLLGTMDAEERVASFLLNLSQRFNARGYAAAEFHLRMTREEIGSYLGLKLETVSRVFSRFQQSGMISIQSKHVRILNLGAMKTMLGKAA